MQCSDSVSIVRLSPRQLRQKENSVALTFGNFDGVHRGHQALIQELLQKKHRGEAKKIGLLTFYPHPQKVLKGTTPEVLTSLREKCDILKELGVDVLYLVRFTPKLASLPAVQFLREYMEEPLHLSFVVVGEDACVGKEREADANQIVACLLNDGIESKVLPFLKDGTEKISSRTIRDEVKVGNLDRVTRELGRPFFIIARVVHGEARGRLLGFPTANLYVRNHVLPPFGVYATKAMIGNVSYNSVTNIGIRPTFGGSRISVETHIFLPEPTSLYNCRLKVSFFKKIRDERKFGSVEELKEQITKDCKKAQELLQLV